MNPKVADDSPGPGDSILEAGGFALADRILDVAGPLKNVEDFASYKIEKCLGRGGMGEVFLARDKVVGRLVAIKFVSSLWPGPDVRRRFTEEAKTMAQLEHPSIARLYEAGVHAETPLFFVMEYVDGRNLDVYCRENSLSVEERLRLFRSACEAVQYAHSRFVLHCDLKPANILVTADGTPKLLDFGIAKQLEAVDQAEGSTQTRFLCTPAFAAPEQFRRGPLDIRTDVYALGVILYQMLSGALPFDVSTCSPIEAGIVIASERGAEKPSVVAHRLAPDAGTSTLGRAEWSDLDELCLKAMRKDASRRYSTVVELIQDIDRYLNGEPLKARPDRLPYRMRKFLVRHRKAALAATLLFASISGLTVFFTVHLARARDAALAEAVRTRRIQRFMLNMFGDSDQQAAPSSKLRVVTLLKRAQEANSLNADPATQAEIYETLGRIYTQLGNLQQADELLRLGLAKMEEAHGPDHARTAAALVQLGVLRGDQGQTKEAEKLVRQGFSVAQRVSPLDAKLVEDAQSSLGRVLIQSGANGKAIEILEPIIRRSPRNDEERVIYRESLGAIAVAEQNVGRYEDSQAHHRKVLDLDRKQYGNRHPRVAADLANLGTIAAARRDYEGAERQYREAAQIFSDWYNPAHPSAVQLKSFVARVLAIRGKDAEATALFRDVLPAQEATYPKPHPNVAVTLDSLGRLARKRGDLRSAEAYLQRAYAINVATVGNVDPHTVLVGASLGEVLIDQRKFAKAEKLLRGILDASSAHPGTYELPASVAKIILGRALLEQARYTEAERFLTSGYPVLLVAPEGFARLQQARQYLAAVYDAIKKPEKASAFRADFVANANHKGP